MILDKKHSSACIAIVVNDEVLMVKANYNDFWTFPSGHVDKDESPFQAAIRETREETGIELDPKDVKLLCVVYTPTTGDNLNRFNFAFVTYPKDKNFTFNVPNDEIEKIQWVAFNEITKYATNILRSYKVFQEILQDPSKNTYYRDIDFDFE